LECVLVAHREIAATAERDEVIYGCGATLGFGDVVASLEVKGCYFIFAPGGLTPLFKATTAVMYPDGFTQGTGDALLLIGYRHLLHVLEEIWRKT